MNGSVMSTLSLWSFDPILIPILLGTAFVYLLGVREVNRRTPQRPWPKGRTVSFLTGLALLWIVLLGPVAGHRGMYFWMHMTQHIVVMMLAAPLLLLGAPVLLLLQASTRPFRRRWIVPVLRSRAMLRITNPFVGWLIFAGTLMGTHFSGFLNFSMEHPLVHRFVENPLYLAAALIFYYPLLPNDFGPNRIRKSVRVVSLFAMMIPETMTGFFIYASHDLMFPAFARTYETMGSSSMNPLTDQQFGGAIMWSGCMIIDAVWVTLAMVDWLRSEERKSQRLNIQTLLSMPTKATDGAP
jgi:putative copper resistance protein D